MSALSVRVLGELTVDGTDLTRLDRKARSLLQLLALARGRAVPADTLVDALWGEEPPARPSDQLAVLASRLRRELGRDRIERTDAGYRLRADWLDVAELEAVVGEAERRSAAGEVAGAVAAARVGLSLARGRVPEPRTASPWALAEHADAVRLVQRARQDATAAFLEAGHWRDALDLAAADALADPLDEEAVRAVMQAQAAGGRPGLALASYAALRATLAEQLGTDPSPETEALNTAILRGEVPVRAAARQPTALVGRTSQAGHLDALARRALDDGSARVAKVAGEAGIGKTTLLDVWSRARRDAGDLVLSGTCGALDHAAPLDVVLTAIVDHLRASADADALLGPETGVLAPLLGLTAAGAGEPRGVDPALGPATLFAAVTAVLGRIAGANGAILVIDDAHLAGQAFADWLGYVLRRPLPVLVVVGVRPAEGPALPATDEIGLGPLDRDQVAELVGNDRADDLYLRSGGHPLFLSELAAVPAGALPPSLVAAVSARCDQLGSAGDLVRAAAIIGDLDVELLAAVLGRRSLHVLGDVELAEQHGLLVEDAGRHRFRHELVREALVTGTTPGRRALLHREAGRVLAGRPDADPAVVADHARLGDDHTLAATWLRIAAARAAERFDHATAEDLLDQSLALVPDHETVIARAQVRIRRGRYRAAEEDVTAATGAGVRRWEVGAWAAYFDRRFDDALRYAEDGALAADDDETRTRCRVASGRILHARGDLESAHDRLSRAMESGSGDERLEAAAWLGVVHAHRSRAGEAVELLRPLTRAAASADHTAATLHAMLFTGHALAVAGRAEQALSWFDAYTAEVTRRDVPRFAGRGINFRGWALRNLGATQEGLEHHHQSFEVAETVGFPEMYVAALEDLAEDRIRAADPEGAAPLLARARAGLAGDLVFGWRLAMKLDLLEAQVQLLSGSPEDALRTADALQAAAARIGVPRYETCARLVRHRALAALGEPVDPDQAWRDLGDLERAVRVEAWWWAGQTGADLGEARWLERSEQLADELARSAGSYGDGLRAEADRHLSRWRRLSEP
ncbi:ATP-binding protein [Nocardioides immobilis]|uniref:ATP-binding protein n=1 Tax=Nocardioides immobilis TaxID=2049295 RepID=UPI0015F84039|nr:BTAD domain-containing putative transcriptional regulator [Nocardioides immobilis]